MSCAQFPGNYMANEAYIMFTRSLGQSLEKRVSPRNSNQTEKEIIMRAEEWNLYT